MISWVCQGSKRKPLASCCLEELQLGVHWANHMIAAISHGRNIQSKSQSHRAFRVEKMLGEWWKQIEREGGGHIGRGVRCLRYEMSEQGKFVLWVMETRVICQKDGSHGKMAGGW